MAMKILISDAFDASLPSRLEKFGTVTDDKGELPTADVVLVRSKTKCTKEYLDEAKNLKLIIRGGVGIDNIDLAYAKEKGIIVRNTPEASSPAVAELAFALMIAIPSNLIPGHATMSQGEWMKKQLKRTELLRKTLGLVGVGRIGTELAMRAKAFGMKVLAFDPYVKESEHAEVCGSLDEMLPQCDYVSIHVPKTDETAGMINKDLIAKMKDGVIIVNTARAAVVVEEDIAAALESGKIRGYGNDVWMKDPPESTPLRGAPNTVLLPHIGASTKENLGRIGDLIVSQIEKFQAGTLESL